MRMIAIATALAATLFTVMAADNEDAVVGVDITAAMQAADTWLAIIDTGRYGEGWEEADEAIQAAMSKLQWEVSLDKVRGKLGGVNRRKMRAANFARDLPGARAGEYVVIQYDTAFETRPLSVETVTPVKQKDGSWKVSGYFVR
jgi:hypothetical protein